MCRDRFSPLTISSSSARTRSYALSATQKMMAVTPSKQWIHFFLSERWPPTSNILQSRKIKKTGKEGHLLAIRRPRQFSDQTINHLHTEQIPTARRDNRGCGFGGVKSTTNGKPHRLDAGGLTFRRNSFQHLQQIGPNDRLIDRLMCYSGCHRR